MNQTLDRVLLARPVALVAGAIALALVNPALQSAAFLFWIALVFGGLTLVLFFLHRAGWLGRFPGFASPVVSTLGWGTYATLTGSLASPFVAAFFLEIAIAAISMKPRGVLGVTTSCLAVLVLMRVPFGLVENWQLHLIESVFITATGALGVAISRRRDAGEMALQTQGRELGGRLESLQRELEDERVVSRVGENVARLAHGLKNAVHSLRGFVSLIEPQIEERAGTKAALAGLRTAIDDLEKLARMTLAEEAPTTTGNPATAPDTKRVAVVADVAVRARAEILAASPSVDWVVLGDEAGDPLVVPISEETLLELLVILMRNAVEAMSGSGVGRLEIRRCDDRCRITVQDEGPGFAPEVLSKGFQPGHTTKEKGSGFGLFLARRIVEQAGGTLELGTGEAGGAVVRVEVPLC